jgi:hypothetical protein
MHFLSQIILAGLRDDHFDIKLNLIHKLRTVVVKNPSYVRRIQSRFIGTPSKKIDCVETDSISSHH